MSALLCSALSEWPLSSCYDVTLLVVTCIMIHVTCQLLPIEILTMAKKAVICIEFTVTGENENEVICNECNAKLSCNRIMTIINRYQKKWA